VGVGLGSSGRAIGPASSGFYYAVMFYTIDTGDASGAGAASY
jgi:hypothetical protein